MRMAKSFSLLGQEPFEEPPKSIIVYQQQFELGRPQDTVCSFGASTCVIYAVLFKDNSCLVAHVDALSVTKYHYLLQCVAKRAVLLRTAENTGTLEIVKEQCDKNKVEYTVEEGNAISVHNGIVTINPPLPSDVDTTKLDKLRDELIAMSRNMPDPVRYTSMEKDDRPRPDPPEGYRHWFNASTFQWEPY
jgi:hypothetical protein